MSDERIVEFSNDVISAPDYTAYVCPLKPDYVRPKFTKANIPAFVDFIESMAAENVEYAEVTVEGIKIGISIPRPKPITDPEVIAYYREHGEPAHRDPVLSEADLADAAAEAAKRIHG